MALGKTCKAGAGPQRLPAGGSDHAVVTGDFDLEDRIGIEEHHVALLILEAEASPDVRFRHLVSPPVRQMSCSVSWRQR